MAQDSQTTPPPPAMASNLPVARAAHLCVLIHGLWGNPGHLRYLTKCFGQRYADDDVRLLVPKSNSGNFTYDGIEIGAERVTKEIEDEVERLAKEGVTVDRLSFVGYSLGGIVGRFAAGLLYHKGHFEKLKPMSFTTFATPHLGVRTPLLGFRNQIWNVLGARTLSETGRQLFLVDKFRDTGRPLLSVMCDPDSVFIKGLAAFKTRTLYSNIINDRTAVFYTTCISPIDPFSDLAAVKINYLPDFSPVLVDAENPVAPRASKRSHSGWFGVDLHSLFIRARLGLFFAVFLPIGGLLFLMNAAVQSVLSTQRIRAHVAGTQSRAYDVPLIDRMRETVEGIRERAEEVFERVNNTHKQQYLVDDAHDQFPDDNIPVTSNGDANADEVSEFINVGEMKFPTLALTSDQFHMIKELNSIGWKKYPVHINKVTHSHAAIIVRMNRDAFSEGRLVISHFLDNFKV